MLGCHWGSEGLLGWWTNWCARTVVTHINSIRIESRNFKSTTLPDISLWVSPFKLFLGYAPYNKIISSVLSSVSYPITVLNLRTLCEIPNMWLAKQTVSGSGPPHTTVIQSKTSHVKYWIFEHQVVNTGFELQPTPLGWEQNMCWAAKPNQWAQMVS